MQIKRLLDNKDKSDMDQILYTSDACHGVLYILKRCLCLNDEGLGCCS